LKISGRFVIFLAHSRYLGDTFNLPYCTLWEIEENLKPPRNSSYYICSWSTSHHSIALKIYVNHEYPPPHHRPPRVPGRHRAHVSDLDPRPRGVEPAFILSQVLPKYTTLP
jgi:hypothetical protein